jgi:hypothetical protein
MASNLIHDNLYFTREEILRRAKEYEYPNPMAVEYFLWDCELAAQLQSVCGDLVLKGGAATQLHLPLERQRGSKDIDIVTTLEIEDVARIVEEVAKTFEGCSKFVLHKPQKPTPNLPLLTYFAHVPSKVDPEREELDVKIDFLCKCPKLRSETLDAVKTYALETKPIKCSTAGTLTGDKLLSLAEGSIGLDIEESYPKQIYDVDALLESCEISATFISDFKEAVDCLTVTEASYRNIGVTTNVVLEDVMRAMDKYSLVDMPSGNAGIKQEIDSFQQFYVNGSQRKRKDEWSTKALRIKFFARLTQRLCIGEISNAHVAELIAKSRAVEENLDKVTGDGIPKLRKEILTLAQTKILHFKDLKGKPLRRVLWQILTPENINDIEAITKQ